MSYLDRLVQKAKDEKPAPVKQIEKGKQEPEPEPAEGRVLIDSYGDVKIYHDSAEPLPLYFVPTPHYKGGEKQLIDALMEIALGVVPLDPHLPLIERRKRYFDGIMGIIDATPELRVPVNAKQFYAKAVVQEMIGYGPIDPLTEDDNLEEIMVIGPGKPVYVYHRKYEMMRTNIVIYEDKDIRNLTDRIARVIGRRIDVQVPLLDARLPDGTRVNATILPISLNGATLTLRKFKTDPLTVIDLINHGTIDMDLAALFWLATDGIGAYPANILVSGGTASGKTTTLNVLSSFIPNQERVISIEDTAELSLPLNHWVRFETRPPSMEGTGEITMNDLVKNSLRMRPDRILVGEIRGAEGYTMFAAMNTGHRGVMGTVHANSAQETLVRLASPPISVPNIMIGSLNLVLMQNRIHDRRKGMIRRITEIAEVVSAEGEPPKIQVLYGWDPIKDEMFPTKMNSIYLDTLRRFTGLTRDDLQSELDERKRVLSVLHSKGVRDLKGVCEVTQNYILRKKLKL
ncbi:MAG: CpaF family protein [Candidatus Micrarchaeota archaeon]